MINALAAVILFGLMCVPIVNIAVGLIAGFALGGIFGAILGSGIGAAITAAWVRHNSRVTWPDRRGRY